MTAALLLVSHGTVDALDDLPAFLANIRRGHGAPPELVAEVRRRYEAIGGRSPLRAICDDVARGLAARLGVTVRACQRLWTPTTKEALAALAAEGVDRVAVLPLAQHSASLYGDDARAAADALSAASGAAPLRLVVAANWGAEPLLTAAFAAAARDALAAVPRGERDRALLVLTAHSLPVAVVNAGDPYADEVRRSAAAVVAALGPLLDGPAPDSVVAFQSQGMGKGPGGRPIEWLGPGLEAVLDDAARAGKRHVVVAPIGFLADHVEVLYDIDIEARGWAEARGLRLSRTASLNASPPFLDALEAVARPLLTALEAP